MTWVPKLRQIILQPKPDFVPDWVYTEAITAKRFYNAEWEFWVFKIAQDYNCSQAKAEDACIRGIKKELAKMKFVYGDKIGKWFEEYLDMDSVFATVKHPEYTKKLDGV